MHDLVYIRFFCFDKLQVWEMYSKENDVLKEKVRTMLVAAGTKPMQKINLINTIERLGLSYHFREEIEYQLEDLFHSHANPEHIAKECDLFNTALSFRIFRQHGYKISCGKS